MKLVLIEQESLSTSSCEAQSFFLPQCFKDDILMRNVICLVKRLPVKCSYPFCCWSEERTEQVYLVDLGIQYFPRGEVW